LTFDAHLGKIWLMVSADNRNSTIGWKARLGVIVLATNLTVEHEFRQMVPEGVSFHIARCLIKDTARNETEKEKQFLEIGENILEAARQVAMVQPAIILFACTIGSSLKGPGHDIDLSEKITQVTGIPSITTASAVLEAIQSFGLKKILLITPYPEEMGGKEKEFLEQSIPGLRVLRMKHLGIVSSFEKNLLPPESAFSLAKEIACEEADGLFISCTAWRTSELIETLEKDLQIPVITSNQASLWACLKRCQVRGLLQYGRLFRLPY